MRALVTERGDWHVCRQQDNPDGGNLAGMAPDDDAPEVFEDEPTHLDEIRPVAASSERQTRTYKSAEYLAGRDAGLKEGIDATVAALREELVRAGCTEDEIKHIIARVRAGTAVAR